MNVVREIERINERELELNIPDSASWHAQYSKSAYIFLAGLDFTLTEGDIICICSQFGEVVDCNLVRDNVSGSSRGFGFVAFEDQRSSILAIDNLNGAKILNRVIRCDHADRYRRPKANNKKLTATETQYATFDGDEDEDYDTRRKKIWDYDKYQTRSTTETGDARMNFVSSAPTSGMASAAPVSYSADISGLGDTPDDLKAKQMLQEYAEKKRQRQAQQQQLEDNEGKTRHNRTALPYFATRAASVKDDGGAKHSHRVDDRDQHSNSSRLHRDQSRSRSPDRRRSHRSHRTKREGDRQ